MKKSLLTGFVLWVSLFISTGVLGSEKKQADAESRAKGSASVTEYEGPMITLNVPIASPAVAALPVAIVNDEKITVNDLNETLATSHEGMSSDKKEVPKINYSEILKRLVNVKLIVHEAKNIGIDELPEIKNMVDVFSKSTLREMLQNQQVKDLKADEKEVEKIYKEMVKEWKIKSLLFEKEDEARKFEDKIKAGGSFDDIGAEALAAGTAKGEKDAAYFKNKDILPQIADALRNMKIGSVSPLVSVSSGYAVFRFDDVRFPDNPEAREEARQKALNIKQVEALTKYINKLSKKYIKLNKNILKSIDFSSENIDINKLMDDKRVIAEIKGDKPVTVGDLTQALTSKIFHGAEGTIKRGKGQKINEKKNAVLQELLDKKILRLEALKKGIHKTEEYKKAVKDYEESLIFGAFAQKVIMPDIKINEEDIKAYYKDHAAEFAYPEMISIESLAFLKVNDAESAIDKLRKGADFNWIKTNAEGQADKNIKDLLSFDGTTIAKGELPHEVRQSVSGASSGDFRLHADAAGHFYVLYIKNVVPSTVQPLEEVMGIISKKVFGEKANKSVEEWGRKLKESGTVRIYLSGAEN